MRERLSALTTVPASAEQRRQVALEIAARCSRTLAQDFGATEVIVFGSLRGDTPWHDESDLDLAVRGVSSDLLLQAHCKIEEVVPAWLSFDLVSIEQVDERVRNRILQNTPDTQNMYLALKSRLADELVAIQQTVDILTQALAQSEGVSAIFVTPTLAAYIEDFYSGCERVAERVAVTLDKRLPKEKDWHRQLLKQMSLPGGKGRPALWTEPLLAQLDRYRRFRHRVRHIYSLELDEQRVLEMAKQVPTTIEILCLAVEQFGEWLALQESSES